MDLRYYAETSDPCGQDRMGEHWLDELLGKDGLCPGGSRRELANGERVEWCEEHRFQIKSGADVCLVSPFSTKACRRIVSKLLIDLPTEED